MAGTSHPDPRIHQITDAPRPLKEDVRSREVRYLISMGVRTACFVLAFVSSGWLRWTCVVAAFILPYVAVVVANAGRRPTPPAKSGFVPVQPRQLPGPGRDDVSADH